MLLIMAEYVKNLKYQNYLFFVMVYYWEFPVTHTIIRRKYEKKVTNHPYLCCMDFFTWHDVFFHVTCTHKKL